MPNNMLRIQHLHCSADIVGTFALMVTYLLEVLCELYFYNLHIPRLRTSCRDKNNRGGNQSVDVCPFAKFELRKLGEGRKQLLKS